VLLKSSFAKNVFVKRLKAFVGDKPKGIDKLPKGKAKAMRSIIQQSGFAAPARLDELEVLMKSEGIIK
jgi:hypothetical protein